MAAPQTERLGVSALDTFFSRLGWLFREQPTHDYGIDAHIEIVDETRPTGKLIALQIKTGTSFFKEMTAGAYIFRTDDRHVNYWVGHSMPVVLILYNPESQTAHWTHVNQATVESTGRNWKIHVSKENMFALPEQTLAALASLTQPEPYIRRLNRLRVDRRWMDLINQGAEVRIAFDDWIHKSLSRYQITIYSDDEREVWPTLYAPGVGVEAMLGHFFPWANFSVDEESHREGAWSRWEAECFRYHDSETGESYYDQDFEEWYRPPSALTHVSENGETEYYVLMLSLNEFGKNFLIFDDYLKDPSAQEAITFAI